MTTYGDRDYFPGVNDTDEDYLAYEDPDTEWIAFAVKGSTTIDVERYRVEWDSSTNATDYVYDKERETLQSSIPLLTVADFIHYLYYRGWQPTCGVEETDTDFQVDVERITF